ncbi:MAG TPA: hypothetical protein VFK47_02925, partial [Ktedonobacteraceae bacterium]|nr:hypothetical protein [Ktedonobacteraceae bacterium]
GDIYIITDNLSSHNSAQTRAWMAEHPRLHHVFIPTGACWLNAAQKAGGASSVVMRLLDKALLILARSSRLPASPPLNSIIDPSPGSGDGLPRIIATIGMSFVTGFNERSTKICLSAPGDIYLMSPGVVY